ncbi:M28 family peptidase [Planctomicrobium sp. SH661]|uniref:M28 family peptidase n=1 Tax=Planctomicrobium sp. SH661 TaxID=3448124 RepID=UPI003F5CA737
MNELAEVERRLKLHVDRLAGQIGSRHLGDPASLQATHELIATELSSAGYQLTEETYPVGEQSVSNLIVELKGTRHPDRVLIVGAHYDTIPVTPGADDNASAVAALLEIARLLAHEKFGSTVRLVFFPCEEQPYFHSEQMGSQVHSRRCRMGNEQLIGMLCLEMLGYYTTEPGSQKLPPGIPRRLHWLFPKRGDFLAAVANPRSWWLLLKFRLGFKRAVKFPLFTIVLPEKIREIRLSDHSNFWDQGYPALMLTDTSFLRNPHYHQASDTPETLDYSRMAEVTMGICSAIRFLAGRA